MMTRGPLTLALIALVGLAGSSAAHDQRLPISGKKFVLKTSQPTKQRFGFTATRDGAIVPLHDPAVEGAALLVLGTGPNAGTSGLITLDPALWRGLGNPAGVKGYAYSDKTGSRGGVIKVLFKPGSLIVKAKGAGWPWQVAGAQDGVQVHFRVDDEWFCAAFGPETMKKNEPGQVIASGALAPAACPAQLCGNGIVEAGEECDDGNANNTDGCTNACTIDTCAGQSFASTWAALQQRIFEDSGCSSIICHGYAPGQGNLDLRPANAYASLVGVLSDASPLKRVEPGDQDLSFLYHKLAAATLPAQYPNVPGSPMPSGGPPPISTDALEALKLWIRAAAPETGVVDNTAQLLASCLPPTTPQKMPRPEPPAVGEGVQIDMPPYPLVAQSEREICTPTYYDFTAPGLVPASAQVNCPVTLTNPSGKCFRWHKELLAQDPQSHHSIVNLYTGAYGVTDPGWGPWTFKAGPNTGQACDPTAVDATGINPGCSGAIRNSAGCVFFVGPPDWSATTSPQFAGAQEPLYIQEFADGVYATLPMQGVVMWNSHAFNLTQTPTTMQQYLNIYFAAPADQLYPVQGIFDDGSIFVINVPPFQSREYCRTRTLPTNARLFHISSHMHKRGVLWRTWGPPNSSCTPGPTCTPNAGTPLYISTDYTDPVQMYFDPPTVISGTTSQRTYKFCAKYDNGEADMATVKRFSTSPNPGGIIPGGPCAVSETRCIGGPNHNLLCNGNHAACDSSPGAGDGDCDACPLRGGVTTEDEMFIWLGSYFVP